MKVLKYEVIDTLAMLLPSLAGLVSYYAKPGTEGLLEDFLLRKGFAFYEPTLVEKPDTFSNFAIVIMDHVPMIDLANGALVARLKPLEPSLN